MREECKHFQSRTYASGEVARFCVLDLAPEAPWRCPENCPRYERRLADVGWDHGSLVSPPVEDEPSLPPSQLAELLGRAETIVNEVSSEALTEVRAERPGRREALGAGSVGAAERHPQSRSGPRCGTSGLRPRPPWAARVGWPPGGPRRRNACAASDRRARTGPRCGGTRRSTSWTSTPTTRPPRRQPRRFRRWPRSSEPGRWCWWPTAGWSRSSATASIRRCRWSPGRTSSDRPMPWGHWSLPTTSS